MSTRWRRQQHISSCLKLTENPGEPEVAEFDDLVFGDENIFRLDVSVNALQERKNRQLKNMSTVKRDRVRNS